MKLKKYSNTILNFINKNFIYCIFFVYFLCNIFYITNNFLFWDDWVVTGNSFKETYEYYKGPGISFISLFFVEIIYHIPPVLARFLVFIIYFISSICLYKILFYLNIKRKTIYFIVIIYTLNPIVTAKYSLINADYFFSTFLFFLASFFLICKSNKIYYYILSLILYFLSFSTLSLLCFYAVPFIIFLYTYLLKINKDSKNIFEIKKIFKFLGKHFVLVILPFLYFIYSEIFCKPTGAYAYSNYNKINFIEMIKTLPYDFFYSFYSIISWLFSLKISMKVFYILLLSILMIIFIEDKKYFFKVIISFIIFFFANFAYFATGKVGMTGNSFNSRHFLLTPLPISLFICLIVLFFINYLKKYKFFYIITCSIFLMYFSIVNIQIGKNVMEDTIIGESIIENYKTNEIIKNNSTFAFSADFKDYGYFFYNSTLDKYNAFGLFWKAFGTENHYSYNIVSESPEIINWYYKYKNDFEVTSMKFWKIREVPNNNVTHYIKIECTDKLRNNKNFLKTYFFYIFNKKLFYEDVKEYIEITVTPI